MVDIGVSMLIVAALFHCGMKQGSVIIAYVLTLRIGMKPVRFMLVMLTAVKGVGFLMVGSSDLLLIRRRAL